jgi:hypothetical protein
MHSSLRVITGLALGGCAVAGIIACSSGDAQLDSIPTAGNYETPGTGFERQGGGSSIPSWEFGGGQAGTASGGTTSGTTSSSGGSLPLSPCSGSYMCTLYGQAVPTTLSNSGGVCTWTVGNTLLTIQPDGTVTESGTQVGTWTGTSSFFQFLEPTDAGTLVVDCQ